MLRDKLISIRVSEEMISELRAEQKEFEEKTLAGFVYGLLVQRCLIIGRRREVKKLMSEF